MAQRGEVVENPVTGERITFLRTARDTDGELLELEFVVRPQFAIAEHVHARQDERLEVQSGAIHYRLGGKVERLDSGQTVVLPAGIGHTIWNDGGDEARFRVEVRPALKTETVIETLFGLARDGKVDKRGMPNLLQMALLATEGETFLPGPPIGLQRVFLTAVSPLSRLMGYRVRYARYSGTE